MGITPGVYESWEECKAQILGVTNARWKRFGTCEEAMQYCFESSLKVDNGMSIEYFKVIISVFKCKFVFKMPCEWIVSVFLHVSFSVVSKK